MTRASRSVAARIVLPLWRSSDLEGVRLYDLTFRDRLTEVDRTHLRAALHLIRDTTPHVYVGLIARLRRLVIVQVGGPEYVPAIHGCLLSLSHLRATTTQEFGLLFVHEATHARLWNLGISYRPELRDRIERICLGAEASWARQLLGGEVLAEGVESRLAHPRWTMDSENERRQRHLCQLRDP